MHRNNMFYSAGFFGKAITSLAINGVTGKAHRHQPLAKKTFTGCFLLRQSSLCSLVPQNDSYLRHYEERMRFRGNPLFCHTEPERVKYPANMIFLKNRLDSSAKPQNDKFLLFVPSDSVLHKIRSHGVLRKILPPSQ